MKNYAHIASRLLYQPLLIMPRTAWSYFQMLEAKLAGAAMGAEKAEEPDLPEEEPMPGPFEDEEEMKQVKKTAIIPVHGTLVAHPEDIAMSECGCSMEELNGMIDAAENDPAISRVIYDFRTPGGTVTGIPETGRKIYRSRKKTIAFTDSECCSGGLWLASQCEHFYATQSSAVGSLGVYCMCLDMSRALAKDGIAVNAIHAGKYKLLGAYWKPLKDDERKILQDGVNKTYEQFKEAVASRREISDKHYGNGLVFDGEEAAQIGFIDGVVESMADILDGMVE